MRSHEVERLVAALWALVFERPDDASLRLALSTALEAAGDGRGEFIRLQLVPAAQRTEAQRRRELMVMAIEGARLGLPGLAGLRRTLAFFLGLPSEVELRLLDADLDRPELALLRRVVVRGWEGAGGVLGSKTWRSLESIEGVPPFALGHLLLAVAPRLRELTLSNAPSLTDLETAARIPGLKAFGWAATAPVDEALPGLRGFVALERMSLIFTPQAWRRPSALALRGLLDHAPAITLRQVTVEGEIRIDVQAHHVVLRATSKTHRFWSWLYPWLGWLKSQAEAEWDRVVVELDGRVLVAAEWREIGKVR